MADPVTWANIGLWIANNWQVIAFIAPNVHDHQQQRRAPRRSAL